MRTTQLAAAIALAFSAAAAQGETVSINPDAAGPAPVVQVGSLDWAVGNAQSRGLAQNPDGSPVLGDVFQTYAHAQLAAFQDANFNPIAVPGLNSAFEWTFVTGFQEVVTGSSGQLGNANFDVTGGGENFFYIYFDSTPDANPLAGTGFADGQLILSGTVDSGTSTFRRTTPPGGPYPNLDNAGTDNYPGLDTVRGTGGTEITGSVTFFDPSFFLTPPDIVQLAFTTQQTLPFGQTNPSALFYNAADGLDGTPSVPGASVANLGQINGAAPGECATCGTTGNVMFQQDANSSFVTRAVPEPASLALLGLGLGLFGFSARVRTKS